jgi:tRNA(Arg) A34 adenosine deaminase TadA
MMTEHDYLAQAIRISEESVQAGGYPAGAVIVRGGEIIATGISDGKRLHDATSHAEIAAIRAAAVKLGERDIPDAVLYTSLEPCLMCYAACFWAHIPQIVFACSRAKVSSKYYEGDHDISELNNATQRRIKLIHVQGMEEEALAVIQRWEKV